ncbi:MAG: Trk system potassium transporter TrkA [Nitrospinae bacterium]|nr:Trk system potassium transporter TrkA [Nitrospinota bacterium]
MRILIVGGGVIGFNIAEELSNEGHDISIVDIDHARIKRISERLDVMAVLGNGCRVSVLKKAGIEDAEMVLAVTNIDEINIVVCILANKFGVARKIARIRNEEFTGKTQIFDPREFFIDHAINQEQVIVESIIDMIKTPGAINVAEFADGEILLRGFDVPHDAPIVGRRLDELKEVSQMDSFLITAVYRKDNIIIPKGDYTIMPEDNIYILVAKNTLPLILPMLNKKVNEIQKVVIYGATFTGCSLAAELETIVRDVTIIEPSENRAEAAASMLSKTIVLYGEGTDFDLLKEANINEADFFMALSDDDELNLLSALLGKKHGAKKVIIITNEPDYLPILDSIDMDIVINPRLITVGAILQHIRKGRIHSVVKLREGEAEIIEFDVIPGSKVIDRKLKEIDFPEGSIVGAIIRNGEMIIPNGSSSIRAGESVVVFALPSAISKIEKLFGKKKLF